MWAPRKVSLLAFWDLRGCHGIESLKLRANAPENRPFACPKMSRETSLHFHSFSGSHFDIESSSMFPS